MSTSGDETAAATFTVEGPPQLLDDAEHELVGKANPVVHQAIRVSYGILRSYGTRNDYDTDPIEDSFAGVDVNRSEGELTVTWRWESDAAVFFNVGTSDHTVHGEPVLSFIWKDAPSGVREMFPDTERVNGDPRVFLPETEPSGLPESRFIQAGLEWLRQEVQ